MNFPNNLSILRILLVPVFVTLLIYYSPERPLFLQASAAVFLLACASDAVDGYLARRLDQKTVLGSYIDPIADKLLLLSGFLSLSFMSHLPSAVRIPAWVTVSVLSRDIIILLGSLIIFITTGALKAEPILIGKATTLFQMVTLLAALVAAPPPVQFFCFAGTLTLTVLSGIQYLRLGGKLLQSS